MAKSWFNTGIQSIEEGRQCVNFDHIKPFYRLPKRSRDPTIKTRDLIFRTIIFRSWLRLVLADYEEEAHISDFWSRNKFCRFTNLTKQFNHSFSRYLWYKYEWHFLDRTTNRKSLLLAFYSILIKIDQQWRAIGGLGRKIFLDSLR